MKGVQFLEAWYSAGHIPAELVTLYQFLLRLVWMHGRAPLTITMYNAIVQRAQSQGFVKVVRHPGKPSDAVHDRIVDMIGDAPRTIYA